LIVDIDVNGRRCAVDVQRTGGGWVVIVEGRTIPVRVAEIDGRWSLLLGSDRGAGPAEAGLRDANVESGLSRTNGVVRAWRSYEVSFDTHGDGPSVVHVNGEAVPISVIDPRTRLQRGRRDGAGAAEGRRAIVAPMPGRIVKVLVERGQTVEARQGVVVVEAMKMENELRAPRAGTVAEVHVREGMSVEAQALLVVLE
jgi:biotin carboxyl carrier protein